MVLGHAITDVNYRNELNGGFGEKLVAAFHILASFTTLAAGIAQHEDLGKFYLSFENKKALIWGLHIHIKTFA